MPIPAQSNQHYTHSVHQLATSQAFVAQPQQPHPSEDFPSSTHPSNAPTTIQNDGATPKAPHRPNAFMVEDANGGKRKTMADEFRAEVEDRTRNGESCEQICAALNARSIQENAAGRPGRAVDNESDSGSESNFHFNPDQSPDAHSFPQGVDHDDDTGAESDDGNDDIEAMDIDVSGRAAPLSDLA
ncbi:hypothetical protein PG990_014623 [Apiospora arundinis]